MTPARHVAVGLEVVRERIKDRASGVAKLLGGTGRREDEGTHDEESYR